MRKSEYEIKDKSTLISILDASDVCRIGLAGGEAPYIVPLNFGYEWNDSGLTLFFHGAGEGRKHDLIAANPHAGFEMDCGHRLVPDELPCDYAMYYQSIIGSGLISVITDQDEKIAALTRIMRKYSDAETFEFAEEALAVTTVFKLAATEFTGKQLNR
jgi:nitroimidazol reductase NimA-like FMN-containing flavoprotein (pyridoxamine 5'-phosphate oxidase superfamily)